MTGASHDRRARFEAMFAADPDPWGFRTRASEQAKFRATRDTLAGRRYARGIEVGCANGELTGFLAPQCRRLDALDVAQSALELARAHVDAQGRGDRVRFRQAEVPRDWPDGPADLIVLSEVLYFLTPDELGTLATRIAGTLEPGGDLLVVNFTGPTEEPLSGRQAADRLCAALSAQVATTGVLERTGPSWRLQLLRRAAG